MSLCIKSFIFLTFCQINKKLESSINMKDINIRSAEEKDISAILAIINHEILHSTVIYDYEEKSLATQLAWFKQKKKDEMPVLVAVKKKEVLGFATFGIFRPWAAYQFSIEHSIYIHKNARGMGIGNRLMQELIKIAKVRKYHTMIAGVDTSNEGSYHFHKQFGFKEIGRFEQVGYKFGKWLDLIFMQLFLEES